MRLRLLLGGILITLLTCLLVAAPSALAATATFEASDPPGDSNGAPDLVGVSALADLDSGAVTITMRFSGALPTKWSLLDSYSVTLGSSSTVGLGCDYLLTEGAVNALASGDGSTGAPGFHWSLGGSAYSGYSTGTPSFNADRTQMTMAFTEPKLVGSKAIVCMSASVYTSDFNKKDTLGPITSNEKAAADARAKSPEVVCPRETGYLNFAGLPDQIAQGRYVPFGVRNDTPGDDYSGDPRDSVVQSRLTMTLKSEQKPFFDSGEGVAGKQLYVQLKRGDGPAVVHLSWRQKDGPTGTECPFSKDHVVAPIRGHSATVTPVGAAGAAGLAIKLQGSCAATRVETIRVFLSGFQAASTDACAGWNRSLTGPRYVTGRATGRTMRFIPRARGHGLLTVKRGNKVILRRVLRTQFQYTPGTPSYRVWQGTDAFINYCINGLKQTYSDHLRLYCWHPGTSSDASGAAFFSRP